MSPFDIAADDASENTHFQGRATSAIEAKKEQDRLKKQVAELEEANRLQENEIMQLEKKNEVTAHANKSPKKSPTESATGKPTSATAATTAKKPDVSRPGGMNDSAAPESEDLL